MIEPLIYVEWDDSSSPGGWVRRRETTKPIPRDHKDYGVAHCRTVGRLIEEDETVLILAHTDSGEDAGLLGVVSIPKASITYRETLAWQPGNRIRNLLETSGF